MLRKFQYSILVTCLIFSGCTQEPKVHAKNLLLICIDTVRADVFYGLGERQKDSLNSWQDRALVFEQATSTSSWTLPALGSVFTGLWASEHGMGQFPGVIASLGFQLPSKRHKDVPLLTEVAVKAGFNTAIITASPWTNKERTFPGFDTRIKIGNIEGRAGLLNLGNLGWREGLVDLKELLSQQPKNSQNLYFLHLMEAHDWHIRPEFMLDARIAKFSAQQRAQYLQFAPDHICEDEQSLLCKRFLVYASAVSDIREGIATTLETLQAENALDDTVVIMFADHGEEFGDHAEDKRITRTETNSPETFFGHGRSLFQEIVHVPLMIWHPQYESTVIKQPVSLVDIGPTAARWVGLEFTPKRWPGRYLDTYLDPSQAADERVVYASEIAFGQQQVSIRQGAKKSVWFVASDENDYYDLATDPHELHSNSTASLVMLFDGLLFDYQQNKPKIALEKTSVTAEQIKDLQSIGYLQGLATEDSKGTME